MRLLRWVELTPGTRAELRGELVTVLVIGAKVYAVLVEQVDPVNEATAKARA